MTRMVRRSFSPRSEKRGTFLLRFAIRLVFLADGVTGIFLLLFPAETWIMLGTQPLPLAVLRWPGGIMLAWAAGSYFILKSISGQAPWVLSCSLGHFLAGFALLFSLGTGEFTGNPLALATIAAAMIFLAIILWAGWRTSRKILAG